MYQTCYYTPKFKKVKRKFLGREVGFENGEESVIVSQIFISFEDIF